MKPLPVQVREGVRKVLGRETGEGMKEGVGNQWFVAVLAGRELERSSPTNPWTGRFVV